MKEIVTDDIIESSINMYYLVVMQYAACGFRTGIIKIDHTNTQADAMSSLSILIITSGTI